jgi:hypothetical protein
VRADLASVPIFVREGAAIPLAAAAQHVIDDAPPTLIALYPGPSAGKTKVYYDDGVTTHYLAGDNAWIEIRLGAVRGTASAGAVVARGTVEVTVGKPEGGYPWRQPWLELEIRGLSAPPAAVREGSHVVPKTQVAPVGGPGEAEGPAWSWDATAGLARIRIPFGRSTTLRLDGIQLRAAQ